MQGIRTAALALLFLGFGAFNTKKITGQDVIDFVRYRQLVAEGALMDEEAFSQVMGKPGK